MRTDAFVTTATKLERISALSRQDPEFKFGNLMHLYNRESLGECFNWLDGKKAVGIDGVTKEEYGQDLDRNLENLLERMKRMAYRPGPVRQVMIPKEGKPGAMRPLGISQTEDKIVQSMTKRILESIYEPLFLDCSYGFRPGRGCHDAVSALKDHLFRNEVETVIDVDLANFFGTIDLKILEGMLREKIADKTFIRYIVRMFKAGVLADGELTVSEEGVPQGSICSPVLANVMAHHVLDEWIELMVKPSCEGRVAIFRYADDAVIGCRFKVDAERILNTLPKRLAKFGLALNGDKTKLVPFSKAALRQGTRQSTFDFLGFTFFLDASQKGYVIPKVKTSGKRLRSKLKRVNDWARKVRNAYRLHDIWVTFCRKIQGHIAYYGVTFNSGAVRQFVKRAVRILFKWLNRRSQRRSFSWDGFNQYLQQFPLPKVRIYHSLIIVSPQGSPKV